MMNKSDNELLTRIGPGTAMGRESNVILADITDTARLTSFVEDAWRWRGAVVG